MGRYASIDYGLARIGVAISDERKIIARSIEMVPAAKRAQESAKRVAVALSPFEIEAIVIGFPIHLNGREGFLADETRAFIAYLKELVACPIIPWEERLTTVQAEKSLREANLSRKKRSKIIDSVTAVIILQNYLEFKRPDQELHKNSFT